MALLATCLMPGAALALSCKDLNSPEKLRTLLNRTKETSPLAGSRLSAYLEVSPCEGETCAAASRAQRLALLQHLHVLRMDDNNRIHILRGPNEGQCLITRGERDSICNQCDATSSTKCRSVVRSEQSSRIPGTNLDWQDFAHFTGEEFEPSCQLVPDHAGLLLITAVRKQGDSPYERIVSVIDAEREVPVTVNFFADNTLRKVYRFFPEYYVKVAGRWVATIVRIRTTSGSEKDYVFETQVRVLPDQSGGLQLFTDPAKDPKLAGYDPASLFFAN